MPTFDPSMLQISQQQRRQQMAQMLMQQGMQPEPTQMAGNVAIRQSPLSALSRGLMSYQGMKGMNEADSRIAGIASEREAADKSAIQKGMELLKAGDQQGAFTAFSASPKGEAYAAELLKSQMQPAPADQRIFEWLRTQPQEVQDAYKQYQTVGQGSYNTPIQTSSGFYGFNNRTGSPTPLMGPNGQPLMPVPADAAVQGNVAQAKAVGTGQGEAQVAPIKALAEKAADKQIEAQFNAPTALALFNDFEKAVMRQPATPLGRGAERAAGMVGLGSEDQQNAIAEGETIASQLMAYAEKLPGPASDKDRIDFKASVGAYADPSATKAQRLAALRQAKKAFERTIKKYGAGAPSGEAPPGSRFQIEVVP
jgi:hypothetical protein